MAQRVDIDMPMGPQDAQYEDSLERHNECDVCSIFSTIVVNLQTKKDATKGYLISGDHSKEAIDSGKKMEFPLFYHILTNLISLSSLGRFSLYERHVFGFLLL